MKTRCRRVYAHHDTCYDESRFLSAFWWCYEPLLDWISWLLIDVPVLRKDSCVKAF
jgi:hypothetical protein